ncbi:MAG: helix-turn-helix transcriptional regulator [Spirochaetia bacterium]|nr:helix-turn-helix transcriptional regulator [Spirochaetia bacterium]
MPVEARLLPDEIKNRKLFEVVRRFPIVDLGPISIRIALFHQTTDADGHSTNWHSHPYYEFTLVRKGKMEYRTEDKTLLRRQGEVVFIPPNRVHLRKNATPVCVLDGFMFEIIETSPRGNAFSAELPALIEKRGFRLAFSSELASRYREIDAEAGSSKTFSIHRLHFLIHDIFYLAFRENFEAQFKEGPEPKALESVASAGESGRSAHLFNLAKTYIDENYLKEISLSDVSNFLGISNRYLNQIFAKKLRLPCGRYIQERKLQHAYEILRANPLLKINEVAREAGYDSYYHFTRAFKKKFRRSPTEIRDKEN